MKNLIHGEFSMNADTEWNHTNYDELLKIATKQNKGTKLKLTLHKRHDGHFNEINTECLDKAQPNNYVEIEQCLNYDRSVFNINWNR